MIRMVSDEVWAQLDPHAGRLTRRATVRLWVTIVLAIMLVAAGVLVWRSGLLAPRLEWPRSAGYFTEANHGPQPVFLHSVTVVNEGWTPVTVLSAGRDGPGLTLTEVRDAFPVTLGAGDEVEFVVVYRVTDCSAVPTQRWPVPVRVRGWYGERTVYVGLPTRPGPGAPEQYQFTGQDPYAVEWQRALADMACHPPS